MNGLLLPLQAEDNRPIRDATGKIVSVFEHARAFVGAVNHHERLLSMADGVVTMLEKDGMPTGEIRQFIESARHHGKLPAPTEASKDDIAVAIAVCGDHDVPEAAAGAILAKFRVYPR